MKGSLLAQRKGKRLSAAIEAEPGISRIKSAKCSFLRFPADAPTISSPSFRMITASAVLLIVLMHIASPGQTVTNGYITALLRSECTSAPPPPPPGQIATGPDYVILTVADGNPTDFGAAQQIVTDAVFELLMPRYCALPRNTGVGCVTNRVQWGIETYDAGGNPRISGCVASGCGFHYCNISNGYITAVLRGESATLPSPPSVEVIAVGSDAVMMTIADGNPLDLGAARQLATDAVFESLMRTYCALPRGTGVGYVSGRAQWNVATFDLSGNPKESGCAASGCNFHSCLVTNGYITALLRSECTSAPPPPPPGQIATGPDYVILTVADGNPNDLGGAQQLVTDAVFKLLMPRYCALPRNTGVGCVTNRVQWGIEIYDAGGNPRISGCAASGCGFHFLAPVISRVSATPNLLWPPNGSMVPVTVEVQADDACGPTRCRIVQVQSNEPEQTNEHGTRAGDWQITGDLSLNLRAERLGQGHGRSYAILVKCEDMDGNSSLSTVTVLVPHN